MKQKENKSRAQYIIKIIGICSDAHTVRAYPIYDNVTKELLNLIWFFLFLLLLFQQ